MRAQTATALAAILFASSCATVPQGPTVAVMPAQHKQLAEFQDDQVVCKHYAETELGGSARSDNTMQAGIALVGTLLGAGLGAAIGGGHGAEIGAGAGAVGGAGIGAVKASKDQGNLQDRYNTAYAQCMATRGSSTQERMHS
jgi:uncharacterized protein YcfJ